MLTNCCIYGIVISDDEQQDCLKHIEVSYRNKLKVNCESCWFLLQRMHVPQNIKIFFIYLQSKFYAFTHPVHG
jgi:predicted aldo/keto reductase-like oxidoreductase